MGHQLLREAAPLRRRMHHEPMHRSSRFARCRPIHALPERVVRGVQCHAACRKTDFVIPRAPDLQRPRRDVPGEAGGVRINLVPLLDAVGAHPGDAGVFQGEERQNLRDLAGTMNHSLQLH